MAEDGTGNAGNSAEQPVQEFAIGPDGGETNTVAQPVPIFEVAFENDIWWSIPAEMSQQMYCAGTRSIAITKMSATRGIGDKHAQAAGGQKETRRASIVIHLISLHGSRST